MDEPFLQQLLSGLLSPLSRDTAAALCAEAWVRLSSAAMVAVFSPTTPGMLQAVICRRSSQQSVEVERAEITTSYSTLLHRQALESIAPVSLEDGQLQTMCWPSLLTGIVVELPASEPLTETQTFPRPVLIEVCRRIMGTSVDLPVLCPNADHLAAMAEFAAGAGHEINNPLGSILGQTQLLLKSEGQIEKRQSLETIGSQAWRIRDMIGDAMLFARPPVPRLSEANLVATVRNATETTATNLTGADTDVEVVVEFRCADNVILMEFDAVQITTLVSQLVRNSIEAILSEGSAGRVSVILRTTHDGQTAELVVRDTGPGIHDPAVRRHLFDPFYSGRPAGRGLGFGLSLAWQIVRMHNGILLQYNQPQLQGCEFHVALPLHSLASRPPAKDL